MSQYSKPLSSFKTDPVSVPIREKRKKMRMLLCVFALTFSKPDKGENFYGLKIVSSSGKTFRNCQKIIIEAKISFIIE